MTTWYFFGAIYFTLNLAFIWIFVTMGLLMDLQDGEKINISIYKLVRFTLFGMFLIIDVLFWHLVKKGVRVWKNWF